MRTTEQGEIPGKRLCEQSKRDKKGKTYLATTFLSFQDSRPAVYMRRFTIQYGVATVPLGYAYARA
jgi:hypothetical protein